MAAKPTDGKILCETITALEKFSNKQKAADHLDVKVNTFKSRLNNIRALLRGSTTEKPKAEQPWQSHEAQLLIRARDENSRLKARLDEALRNATSWGTIREQLFQLTANPIQTHDVPMPKQSKGKHLAEAVILHLSDLHWGEVIDEHVMAGQNRYNMVIASWRLTRCFQTTIDLMTKHWPRTGEPPSHLILMLGGDLISGDIHDELKKTNELQSIPTMVDCIKHLALGISMLLDSLPCPITIYSVPGNHGRTTFKPECKTYVDTNYDTLIADMLEWHFVAKGEKRLTFVRPQSGDALFKVFGHQIFLTHGDRIGSRGGQGFIGPAATIARGMKKVVDEYAAMKVFIDYIFLGHFHTSLKLEYGYANGSLPGPSEYSRDLRSRPHGATQNYFTIHPERGITSWREIQVGRPDEGLIYRLNR
jgi:hypothetical protein